MPVFIENLATKNKRNSLFLEFQADNPERENAF